MLERVLALSISLVAAAGCAQFDGPPEPSIRGLVDGLLDDAKAPIVVDFSRAVDESTLTFEIAPYTVDAEGNLPDEDDDPNTDLAPMFSYLPGFPIDGTGAFGDGDTSFSAQPDATPPVGPRLVVLVEPGLASTDGVVTVARRKLVFGYDAKVECDQPTTFPSGYSFFLADVKMPIATQVQLYASIQVDPMTGAFVGQFTNADRRMASDGCPMQCPAGEACRLLPSPMCAMPSDPAGTVDEYSDYVPNDAPPLGYSFTATGCVVDQPDGTTTFTTAPTDVAVTMPDVTLRNARLTGSFSKAGGVYRLTGSFSADDVLLGDISSGGTAGNLTARSLTKAEAPPGIPDPPQSSTP